MDAETQFWWNWAVHVVAALGTLGAVVVALFRDAIRAWLLPPQLELQLFRPEGEKTPARLTSEEGTQNRLEDARYYHLRVSNQRRWSRANQVQVFLVGLEEPGPDGELQITWSGDVPTQVASSRDISGVAYNRLCSRL